MLRTSRLNMIIFALYTLAALGVMGAALAVPAFRAAAYAPLRDVLLPPPRPIVVDVLYSTEKEAWIEEAVIMFEAANPQVDGRPIDVVLSKSGSREMYLAVLDGSVQPTVISPASTLQIAILDDLSRRRLRQSLVRPNECISAVNSPLVLVAWQERAEALWGGQPGRSLWQDLHQALTAPDGWSAYGHPEWGFVKFGHTDPLRSNSGFQTILLMTYAYHEKTSGLTNEDILADRDYQAWFLDIEDSISEFGDSTGTYMLDIVAYGPSRYDIVAVYESTAIEQIENAAARYGPLRVYYPPATHLSDHPFCILEGDWITPEQAEAAQVFIDYLMSEPQQTAAVMQYGFRPGAAGIDLEQPGSPFVAYQANGISPSLPPEVEVPSGDVLNTLLEFWDRGVNN